MQVILFENIERLGMQGDVVNVANGYYRNFLNPRGIAMEATPRALARMDMKRKKLHAEAEKQLAGARDLSSRLNEAEVKFVMKATDGNKLFGSVSAHEIVEKLAEQGFEIERRQVLLKEPIKTTGQHDVKIRMLGNVEAHVKVIVEPDGGVPVAAAAPETNKAETTPAETKPVAAAEAQSAE